MLKKSIFLIAILFLSLNVSAQEVNEKKADKSFAKFQKLVEKQKMEEAFVELRNTINYNPNHLKARKYLAQYHKEKKEYEAAFKQYKYIVDKELTKKPGPCYGAGEMAFKCEKYEEAVKYFDILLAKPNLTFNYTDKGGRLRGTSLYIIEAQKTPVEFDPENLGDAINTQHHEYFPSITADGELFIYTRRLPRGNGQTQEDFYETIKGKDGNWLPARPVGAPINTMRNEGASSITTDGKTMFFTKCSEGGMDKSTYGSCDIFAAQRVGHKWTEPYNLGNVINSSGWDAQACMASDGQRLYFSSNRPGGKGGKDIWYVNYKDGTWSIPINAGDSINTPGDEYAPFIHPDGMTLYFASNYHLGMGGYDFFMTRRDLEDNWSTPKNLGYPINTRGDEYELFIESDGGYAFMATERFTPGNLDIFRFKLPENVKPRPVIYVKGKITDKKSKMPIATEIELIDRETGETHTIASSDKINGEYLVVLPLGMNFAFVVDKKGYLFHTENFSLKGADEGEPYVINVGLNKIRTNATTVMKNTFYETGSYKLKPESFAELNVLYEMLMNNPKLKVEIGGHTDNVGSYDYNQKLSENRAKTVHDYLIAKGINPDRLSYKGYAYDIPVKKNLSIEEANKTDALRAQNRRTEIKILEF